MYKAAERVRDLQAWEWMEEDDIFAVVNPENPEEIAFCSLMGSLGTFTALAIYKGWEGYESYLNLRNSGGIENKTYMINVGFMQSCWMVEFADASEIQKSSKDQLKELGIKYRGKGQWVDISDRKPGLLPWFIQEKDVPFITLCINQFFEIALRAEEDSSFLHQPNPNFNAVVEEDENEDELMGDEELLIFRKATAKADGKWVWFEEAVDVNSINYIEEISQRITPSIAAASLKKKLKQKETCLMIGMMVIPAPIQEDENEAPYLTIMIAYLLFGQQYVIKQELFKIDEIRPNFERLLLQVLSELDYMPSQFLVNMDLVAEWLESYSELFEFEIFVDPEDENFEDFFEEFTQFLGNMP